MMANGGKLLSAMVVTVLWLPLMEGVMAAERQEVSHLNQSISRELWPLSDLVPNSAPSSLEMERSLSQLTLAPPQTLAHADLRLTEANRLLDLGIQEFNRSQFWEAIASWERALELYRAVGDRAGEGSALNNLGEAYRELGQYERAIDLYEQFLVIAREIGDSPEERLRQRAGEGTALDNLGVAYFSLGQYQRAINFHEQWLAISREIGDRAGEVRALGNLGNVYSSLGQYQGAIDVYQQQLAIARQIGDRAGEGDALAGLAEAYRNLGQYERALEKYRQAITLFNDLSAHSERAALLEFEGQLEDGDEVLQDGSLYGLHTFEGEVGQFVEIRLNSDDFDAYLILVAPDGEWVAEDDDGGEGLNSLIFIQLPQTGRYSVIANAHDASGRGHYRLTVAAISAEDYQRGQERASVRAEAEQLLEQGIQQFNRSQFREALDSWQRALELYRVVDDRPGEGRVLGNLGNAYNRLGQYERAIEFYEQILVLFRDINDRAGEGNALGNLGNAYRKLGQYERTIDFHEQALVIFREIGARAEEGFTLGNLGNAYDSLGQYERAINFHEQALAIAREISNPLGEGSALGGLGVAYFGLGQYDRALEQYGQAVALFNELGARADEAHFLSNIGRLLNDQNQPELAIIFLKASVEVREAIRGDIRGLDTDLQQSFTDTVADSYRLLADLLLQQDRVLEAQRVLDLLKIQELDEALSGVRSTQNTATGVAFWQIETDLLTLYQETLADGIALARLDDQVRQQGNASLTPAQRQQRDTLRQRYQAAQGQFAAFLDRPEVATRLGQIRQQTDGQSIEIERQHRTLQNNLRNLPQPTALIYPLILPDRLELILVTADSPPLRYPIAVTQTELNRTIVAFGQALRSPTSDILPLAQTLHHWLIAPLEAQLTQAGIEAIIYAPDGALRYVPLAALHDGDRYLAQRFSLSHITAASLTDFSQVPQPDNRRLLAAACAECSFEVPIAGQLFRFGDLPFTEIEVNTLATQVPNTRVLLNRDFSIAALDSALGGYRILHLATHGAVVPNQPSQSFLLLGSGEAVSLETIRNTWRLDAELVVLSACETAVGNAELGSGIEILGLGYQIQQAGAQSVMASLWNVNDQGTQILMSEFYDALQQGLTKKEALQAAQIALITGDYRAVGGQRGEIELRGGQPGSGDALAHPYYWAPFILIGNGL